MSFDNGYGWSPTIEELFWLAVAADVGIASAHCGVERHLLGDDIVPSGTVIAMRVAVLDGGRWTLHPGLRRDDQDDPRLVRVGPGQALVPPGLVTQDPVGNALDGGDTQLVLTVARAAERLALFLEPESRRD